MATVRTSINELNRLSMNVFKGYLSTVFGLVLMCATAAEWLGWVKLADPDIQHKSVELLIAFLIGAVFLFVPPTILEQKLETGLDAVFKKYTKNNEDNK